jgi:hypothetical protein
MAALKGVGGKDLNTRIKQLLEGKTIYTASFDRETGKLTIVLEDGTHFYSFYCEGDLESWELFNSKGSIYASEYGGIIYY